MELEFLNQPPSSILSHELFPDPVVIHFIPFTRAQVIPFTRHGLGRRPWVLGQQELLLFRTEFIPVGRFASQAVRTTSHTLTSANDVTTNTVSSDEICAGKNLVCSRPSAPAVPGIYKLQVSVFVCRPDNYNRGTLVARTVSYTIDVQPNYDLELLFRQKFESAKPVREAVIMRTRVVDVA